MIHPKYGHITYRVSVYETESGTDTPYTREFEHWQSAYAWAKRSKRESVGIRRIDILKHRFNGFIFTGILRWTRSQGRII